MIKHISLLLSAVCYVAASQAVNIEFFGQKHDVMEIVPEKSTGLDMIYVVYDASELNQMRVSDLGDNTSIKKYRNLGGGFAEPVTCRLDGNDVIVDNPEGNMGYIITSNDRNTCIWIVDYHCYMLQLNSVESAPEQYCDNTQLNITGTAEPIHYYTIDGRQAELSRDINVVYHNLEWDEATESYVQKQETKTLAHLSNPVVLTPPLYCNSTISVSGDRFLATWGMEKHLESGLIYANGVAAMTTATQTNLPDDGPDAPPSNTIKAETQGMGGSAPADIEFRAFTTDAVIHNEWQIASDQNFEYIDYRFNEQNLDYSFTDEGTYYVRFVGSNSDGTCETIGETYTVSIGASDLRIPNAFTPNDDGVNDEWKVAYRSLLSFKCTIFDRYGNEITSFDDPNKGWNGKYKGKLVKPGVYFYVIEAKGADGKKYKKGGDINLIRSKRYSDSNSGQP